MLASPGQSARGKTTLRGGGCSILVATELFPNAIQPYVVNTIEAAVERGAKVTIIAGGKHGGEPSSQVHELGLLKRTRYVSAESARGVLFGLAPYIFPFTLRSSHAYVGLRKVFSNPRWRPSGAKAWIKGMLLGPILGEGSYDFVHAHNVGPAYGSLPFCRILGIPLITTFHGLPPPGMPKLAERKLREVFEVSCLFLVNTRFARVWLASLGCPAEKIRILPQGLRLEEFPFRPGAYPKDGAVVLLTVCRLARDKGLEFALQAVARLVPKHPSLEYRIIGNGPEKDNLQNMANRLDLGRHVRFLGEVANEDLPCQYAGAHLFLLPSVRDRMGYNEESQGVVIQEAQASGVIVVATKTGGIPECVDDGRSAFLVPDRDPEAIAQKIDWLLEHPERWEEFQKEGRAWVENHFDMKIIGQRLWEIYDEVITAGGR